MKALILAAFVALMFVPSTLHAQETIAAARDLYTAANYDDALVVLGRLDASSQPSDRLAINQYRAFCLVALGRTAEAERAIEAVVSAQPLYRPTDADASPRLRSAFTSVRQRILPSIVQQQYALAKAAFDRQDFTAAAVAFDQVLQALSDPDLGTAASRPPLSDLRTLATGFRDLSAKAVVPPPVQVAQPLATPPPAPTTATPAVPAAAMAKRIYGGTEPGVSPPAILRQELPPLPKEILPVGQGVLEVVINEVGQVESATMRATINPRYDALVITAARSWKYRPAMLDGAPVKYRKFISISLKSGD
jgi:tetratricopeptide (TPR) repeat protein